MNAVVLDLVQGTPEWVAARRDGIGASDLAVIAGESPYKSPLDLWAEKRGLVEPVIDAEQAELFEIGHLMEPTLLAIYERRTGRRPERAPNALAHPEIPWARASLDAIAPVERIVEAKWTNSTRWPADGIPEDVRIQCQWQMFVTGWKVADVVALVGRSARVVEVPRDDAYIDDLYALAEDFWSRVESGERPAVDGRKTTTRTLASLYPADDGTLLPASTELASLVSELRDAKAVLKAAEEREATLGNALRAVLGDAAGIDGLCTYRKNADAARVNWPAVASEYRALLLERETADVLDEIQAANTTTAPGPRVLRLSKEK